jgi:hypothetical protein
MNVTRTVLAVAVAVTVWLAFASSAGAATVQVTTDVDQTFVNDSSCSLREAIGLTNADTATSANGCTATGTLGADTITFAPALVDHDFQLINQLNSDGELLVTDTDGLTITGPGRSSHVFAAPGKRVIESTGGVPLSIGHLTLQDGSVSDSTAVGGGIAAGGNLTLDDVRVFNNTASASDAGDDTDAIGGGVYAAGILTISNSVIEGNTATAGNESSTDDTSATAQGGGIAGGTMTITDSTITGNTASASDLLGTQPGDSAHTNGGGIASPALTLVRSTVTGNQAIGAKPTAGGAGDLVIGGGIFVNGASSIELSTISGNETTVDSNGADIGGGAGTFGALTLDSVTVAGNGPVSGDSASANLWPNATITMKNTIVADPRGAGSTNCSPTVTSNGFNLDDDDSCGLDQSTDQTGTDPDLGTLTDNGGPTETMLPEPGSAAIDKGSSLGQTDTSHDQRGLSRPVQSTVADATGGDGSDIGAVEAQAPPAPTVTGTSPNSPTVFDTSPEVIGSTSPGPTSDESPTSVGIFKDSACGTEVDLGRGSPTDFSTTGLTAIVDANATTALYANASNDYEIASPCSSTFATYKHDSLGPVMTIDSGPSDSSDHTPTFTFHGTDASPPLTYECSVDTGTPVFAPCSSPFTSESLPDGAYTFRVQGTDAQGEGGAPASRTFTIATPPPTVTPPTPAPAPAPKKKKCRRAKKHKASAAKKKCKKKK